MFWIACLSWFADQLNALQADSRFRVKLYVTREPVQETQASSQEALSTPTTEPPSPQEDPEKDGISELVRPQAWRTRTLSSSKETENFSELASPIEGVAPEVRRIDVQFTRPKIAGLLDEAFQGAVSSERVLVMACGPPGLRDQVRGSTAQRIQTAGPSVELHCESFGW